MVRRDAEADQAVGDRIAVEDVDAGPVAERLFERLGGIEARRAGTDYREMPHPLPLVRNESLASKAAGERQPGMILEEHAALLLQRGLDHSGEHAEHGRQQDAQMDLGLPGRRWSR